jgi:putative transposase
MSTRRNREKHSAEEIVRELQQADKLLAEGNIVPEVCRQREVSEPTYYQRRKQYAGLSVEEAGELRALREENARLKPLVAEWSSSTDRDGSARQRCPWAGASSGPSGR